MSTPNSIVPAVDPNSIQFSGQVSLDGKRNVPTLGTLTTIVEHEVATMIVNKQSFTSYGVTLALRNQYPMLEIEHLRTDGTDGRPATVGIKTVQELVHDLMPNLMTRYNIPYIVEDHLWGRNGIDDQNGKSALTYVPYNALAHGAQTVQNPVPDVVVGLDDTAPKPDVQIGAVVTSAGVTIFVHNNDPKLPKPKHVAQIDWPTDLHDMFKLPATTDDETVIE